MFSLCKEEFICNPEIVTILFCECSNKFGVTFQREVLFVIV